MKNRTEIIAGILIFCVLAAGCGRITTPVTPAMTTTSNITQPSSSMTTDNSGLNSASTDSVNGLSLLLAMDRTTYQLGQSVSIIVDEKNLLSTTNDIPAADNLPPEFRSGFPDDPSFPLGLAVLRGNYTGANYSTATPLIIFNPGEIYNGTTAAAPTAYSFSPFIDVAILNGDNYDSSDAIGLHIEISVNGYWPNNESASSNNFEPGIYTIIAGDEWGTLVVLHFTVAN
jgi:hypothetical protein